MHNKSMGHRGREGRSRALLTPSNHDDHMMKREGDAALITNTQHSTDNLGCKVVGRGGRWEEPGMESNGQGSLHLHTARRRSTDPN